MLAADVNRAAFEFLRLVDLQCRSTVEIDWHTSSDSTVPAPHISFQLYSLSPCDRSSTSPLLCPTAIDVLDIEEQSWYYLYRVPLSRLAHKNINLEAPASLSGFATGVRTHVFYEHSHL